MKTNSIVNRQATSAWKEELARAMRWRPLNGLLAWGVRATVPRQRVGVALVAFNANEELFLLRHVFHPAGPWGLPGGWLNRNEAPADGVARELREETGLGVELGPVIHVGHEKQPPHIAMAYLGQIQPGPMRFSIEVLDAQWFALDRLPQPLHPFARRSISDGLALFRSTLPTSPTSPLSVASPVVHEAQALT